MGCAWQGIKRWFFFIDFAIRTISIWKGHWRDINKQKLILIHTFDILTFIWCNMMLASHEDLKGPYNILTIVTRPEYKAFTFFCQCLMWHVTFVPPPCYPIHHILTVFLAFYIENWLLQRILPKITENTATKYNNHYFLIIPKTRHSCFLWVWFTQILKYFLSRYESIWQCVTRAGLVLYRSIPCLLSSWWTRHCPLWCQQTDTVLEMRPNILRCHGL